MEKERGKKKRKNNIKENIEKYKDHFLYFLPRRRVTVTSFLMKYLRISRE